MQHRILLLLVSGIFTYRCSGNSAGANSTGDAPATGSTTTKRRIFVMTPDTTQGNTGGAAGADTKCNNASNKPSGATTFRALVADATRRACTTANCTAASENLNWIMLPNTKYYRADGTTEIQSTNGAGVFALPLAVAVSENSHLVYTGIHANWTSDTTNNCVNWTSNNAAQSARAGFSDSTTGNLLGQITIACDSGMHLLCVEQ
ncbi:MAG: DUF1554 domain-containing protein [Spirochaetota bacterium]